MPEIPHVPLHHMRPAFSFLVSASFANKQNNTAGGWGVGAQCIFVEPELSPCFHLKKNSRERTLSFSSAGKQLPEERPRETAET
jgi:hypothetical protein